ncbi:MAG: hypothetical protein ABSA01_13790, partial [Anaerolineales bacterium]
MRKLISVILIVFLSACNLPTGRPPASPPHTETTPSATPLPVYPTASLNPALPTENPSSTGSLVTGSLVYVPGSTQKVCQLLGDVDWETGLPTAARTLSNGGLLAADLGYPVEHQGKLILLFGDSWPPPHPQ